MTAQELLELPRGISRYELLEGELRTVSPAGHTDGKIAARFTAKLFPFVEEQGLGEVYAAETGFLLGKNPDTVRAPDAAFVSAERLADCPPAPEGFSLVRRTSRSRWCRPPSLMAMSKARGAFGSKPESAL